MSGLKREGSDGRGPYLVLGLALFLVCAPLAASFYYPVRTEKTTFSCECGANVDARGTQNYWGQWLEKEQTTMGRNAFRGSGAPNPATCKHEKWLPWTRTRGER